MERFPRPKVNREEQGGKHLQNFEKSRLLSVLASRGREVFFVSALIAATMQPEKVRAIEMPPGADWGVGAEALRESASSDQYEVGAIYLEGRDGVGKWVNVKEGEITGVKWNISELRRSVDTYEGEVSTVCSIHTHPVSTIEETGWISEESREREGFSHDHTRASAPPSLQDVGPWNTVQQEEALGNNFNSAVFDTRGVWYYRTIHEEDMQMYYPEIFDDITHRREVFKKVIGVTDLEQRKVSGGLVGAALALMSEDEIRRIHRQIRQEDVGGNESEVEIQIDEAKSNIRFHIMMNDNPEDPVARTVFSRPDSMRAYIEYINVVDGGARKDLQYYKDVKTEWVTLTAHREEISPDLLQKIYEGYARNGAYVRFVSHEDTKNEPPCAGPDYQPK